MFLFVSSCVSFSRKDKLFSGFETTAVVEQTQWSVWRPLDAAIPAFHPMGQHCEWSTLRLPKLEPQPVCLIKDDWISRRVRKMGRWEDCRMLIELWKRSNTSPGNVLLEIGANIGMCTMEFLHLTNALVVAFEPNPTSLYYLTRTIQHAATRDPTIADRVVVYPIASGSISSNDKIFAVSGNQGNAVIGQPVRDRPGKDLLSPPMNVTIRKLDSIFQYGIAASHMMKVDVQGFEVCAPRHRMYQPSLNILTATTTLPDRAVQRALWRKSTSEEKYVHCYNNRGLSALARGSAVHST